MLVYKKTIILAVEAKPNLPQSIDYCGNLQKFKQELSKMC